MEIFAEELTVIALDASTREEAIKLLSALLYENNRISSKDMFYEEVMHREEEYTTGFGEGFAIPHGKTDAVIHPSLVAAKCQNPLEWGAMDGNPVTFIFLIAVPDEAEGTTHLKMISILAENLMDDKVKKNLKKIDNDEELYHYVQTLIGGKIR